MTKERKELEQKVDNLVGKIDFDQKEKEYLQEINQLRRDNLRLKNRLDDRPSRFKGFGRFIDDYVVEPIKEWGLIVSLVIALSIGGYKGCSCMVSKFNEPSRKRETVVNNYLAKDQNEVPATLNDFLNTVNLRDREAVKEYLICGLKLRGDDYNFVETITDKVLNGNYSLKEINILDNIIPKISKEDRMEYYTLTNRPREYKFKTEIVLANSEGDESTLKGQFKINCLDKCEILISKGKKDFCPSYARIK